MNFLKKNYSLSAAALEADRFDLKHHNRNSNLVCKTITKTILIFLMTIATFSCSQDDDNKPPENPTIKITVSTFAGSGNNGDVDGTGVDAEFSHPFEMVFDTSGNLYVTDEGNDKVRKITPQGVVSTFVGSGVEGFTNADSGINAQFDSPRGIAIDASGNIFVADYDNHVIRKISPTTVVTTFAGNGNQGDSDDNIAEFDRPRSIAIGTSGNIYVAERGNHKIRKIIPQGVVGGAVSTFAGNGTSGDVNGIGINAQFNKPKGVVVDNLGNIYISDAGNHKIKKITPLGEVSTFAGSGIIGDKDGLGVDAQFNGPRGLVIDTFGNVYVADWDNHKIRKITPQGEVSTLAGTGVKGDKDGLGVDAQFHRPLGLVIDASNNIFVTDENNHKIRKITQE